MKTIFVNGLSGKMGTAIQNLVSDESGFKIVKTAMDSDLIIDFSRPESTVQLLQEAEEHAKPMIIGTTGFSQNEIKLIEKASKKTHQHGSCIQEVKQLLQKATLARWCKAGAWKMASQGMFCTTPPCKSL